MKWMGWSYADLLAAPAHLVDRIVHHLNERAQRRGGEPGIEL